MNQHDRDNLNFLLSADTKTLKDWHSKVDQDDLDYAMELLEAYSRELDERSAALLIEAKLAKQEHRYPEAMSVISKFML